MIKTQKSEPFKVYIIFQYAKILRKLKKQKYCGSSQWLSFSLRPCSHCMRIVMEGLSVEGQILTNRGEQVNFEIERDRLFHLYEGRNVLNRRLALEKRIIESFGMAFFSSPMSLDRMGV